MAIAQPKKPKTYTVTLDGRRVLYSIRNSTTAKQCRVRVGPAGVEVIIPKGQPRARARSFVRENATWVLDQLSRVNGLSNARNAPRRRRQQLLLRGQGTQITVEQSPSRRGNNVVEQQPGHLLVRVGSNSTTTPPKALENWFRRQARCDIGAALRRYRHRLRRRPGRIYVMGQRTKWGNCSSRGNLSFNWRLIMAPPYVLDYVVIHELVHLAIPNHSAKFWLTVRSHCPDADKAREWLRRHEFLLMRSLATLVGLDGPETHEVRNE